MKSLTGFLEKTFKTYIWVLFVLVYSCRSRSSDGNYQTTTASYYAHKFNGKKTASGEVYRHHRMTAANKTLPFGTRVEIVNVENDKSVVITVNDRGPLKPSRQFDLSQGAFKKIAHLDDGVVKIKFKVLK